MKSAPVLAVPIFLVVLPACAAAAEIEFVDATSAAGLRAPLEGMLGHGAAWGDVDQDGDADLFCGCFADRPTEDYAPRLKPPANVLLLNRGAGTFKTFPDAAAASHARTSGGVFADLDNDGWPELYVANNAKAKVRTNRGEIQRKASAQLSQLFDNRRGTLVEISGESGACQGDLLTARNVGLLDYDLDGKLDLLVVEDRFTASPRSRLYRNLGGLRFEDRTTQAGLPEDLFGLGLAIGDVNGDGRADIFVGHSNRFFLSDGTGALREPASLRETFAWDALHGEDWPCGAAFGDLNGDGRLDLVLGIHGEPARNRIYLNRGLGADGVPRFDDVTAAAGLPESWPQKCPHVEVHDFDNDGRLDIYFSGAWLAGDGAVTPLVYRNLGNAPDGVPRFVAPGQPAGAKPVYFPAGPSADFDNDGRIDLFLVNWFAGNHSRLMRNVSTGGGWLRIKVRSAGKENRDGVGGKVTLRTEDGLLGYREIAAGYGYASGQEAIAHFGVGSAESVDVEVRTPRGHLERREGVAINQTLTVEVP